MIAQWRDDKERRKERYLRILRTDPCYREAACEVMNDSELTANMEGILVVTCSCVIGPMLHGFVQWLIDSALENKVERIYFLARDGYLMYRIAKRYCDRFKLEIDCRYLYCSRYSLRVPMYHKDINTALDFICRGGIEVTVKKILGRTGLPEYELNRVLDDLRLNMGKAGLNNKNAWIYFEEQDQVIPYSDLIAVRDILANNKLFVQLMSTYSEIKWPMLREYLEEQGIFDNKRIAIADSGWTGSMQRTFSQILDKDLEGYYYGLYEIPADMNPQKYHCFFFSPVNGFVELKKTMGFNNCLFEGIVSAPHGMTIDYRHETSLTEETPKHIKIVPVLDDCQERRNSFMREVDRVLMEYTDFLFDITGAQRYDQLSRVSKKTIKNVSDILMSTPSKDEARVFGSIPFSDDVHSETNEPIAAHLTERELNDNHFINKTITMLHSKRRDIHESAWYEGSAVMYSRVPDRHLRSHRFYKRILAVKKHFYFIRNHRMS